MSGAFATANRARLVEERVELDAEEPEGDGWDGEAAIWMWMARDKEEMRTRSADAGISMAVDERSEFGCPRVCYLSQVDRLETCALTTSPYIRVGLLLRDRTCSGFAVMLVLHSSSQQLSRGTCLAVAEPDSETTRLHASRQCSRIEEVLYETIHWPSCVHPSLSDLQTTKSREFLARTVRCVVLSGYGGESAPVLRLCPGVTRLALGNSDHVPEMFEVLVGFRNLRYLAIHAASLMGHQHGLNTLAARAALPAFAGVTHLELLDELLDDRLGEEEITAFCPLLPSLTHLALNNLQWPMPQAVLGCCPNLAVLVGIYPSESEARETAQEAPPTFDDPRLAFAKWVKWEESVTHAESFWDVVEAFQNAKRKGKHGPRDYFAAREAPKKV
ncbi:hypothetical protein MKEN_01116300 [Mycena kentingensis (nom. inval.)]|nr:hypothetical protein MKEN_01116300 [Mycena kentingensis (nom. inval.)]